MPELQMQSRLLPTGTEWPRVPTTVSLPPRHKTLLTLLPPPVDASDPLAIVDIARTAEVKPMSANQD